MMIVSSYFLITWKAKHEKIHGSLMCLRWKIRSSKNVNIPNGKEVHFGRIPKDHCYTIFTNHIDDYLSKFHFFLFSNILICC